MFDPAIIRHLALGCAIVVPATGSLAQTRSTTAATASSADSAALRQAIDGLTREVVRLRIQIARDQADSSRAFNANVTRLNLVQADLDHMRRERADQIQKQRDAEAKVDQARYRLANIQQQLGFSQELDRTNAEERIREILNRQVTEGLTDSNEAQQRVAVLDGRIERTERIVETLHRRLKIDETQIDVVDEPEPKAPESPSPPTTTTTNDEPNN